MRTARLFLGAVAAMAALTACEGGDTTPPDGGASVVEESSPPPLTVNASSNPSCTPQGGTATIVVKNPDPGVTYRATVFDDVVQYGDVVTELTNPTAVSEGLRFTFRCKGHPAGQYGVEVTGGDRSGVNAFDVFKTQS